MKAVTQISGSVVPLARANVDTDQIIPKQFLKSIRRTGFGDNLFDGWRFLDEGEIGRTPNERTINPEFVLNDARYQGACILLAQHNFGCGSSREHAVWALLEYGIDCVIAPSFADIFFANAMKNGLLPVVLNADAVGQLFELATGDTALTLLVDLPDQSLRCQSAWGSQPSWHFDMDPLVKDKLLRGEDDIAATLTQGDEIRAFEARHRRRQPWIFSK